MRAYFLLAAALLVVNTVAAGEMEWPAYKGNSGLTGLSADDSLRPPFRLAWTYRLDGDFSGDGGAGVTVAGGKVFANIHNTRSILALDARTGRFVWEYKESPIGYLTVPTYAEGRLFLLQRQHRTAALVVLDVDTGRLLWQQALELKGIDPHRAGLPVVDGRVYCSEGGEEPAVTAFEAQTGKTLWRTSLGTDDGTSAVTPIVAGGKLFVATRSAHTGLKSTAGATVAMDAATGEVRWRRRGVYPSVSLTSDGRVVACGMFLSKDDERFHLLDAQTGDTLWTAPRRFHYAPATITDQLILIKPYGSNFIAVDRETGKQQWEFVSPCTSGCCSPVVAGKFAYMGTGVIAPGDLESPLAFQHGHERESPRAKGITGTLHAIDLQTGKSVWHFGTGNTICGEPALAYGRLYFASRDGCIYCFQPAKDGETVTPEAKDTSPSAKANVVAALLEPQRVDRPRPGRDWPMLGGGADRAGLELPPLNLPLEPAWKFDTGGRVVVAAAIRDGKALFGSDSGKFYAVDLPSGAQVWQQDFGASIRCSPAAADDLVYCGADNGNFCAFNIGDGRRRWTFAAGGPIRGSPVLVGGVILFGANDHNLYALDRQTGRKLWSFRTDDYCVQVPPAVHGQQVFCAQWTEQVYALDLLTGKENWRSYIPVSVEALSYYQDKLWVRNVHYLLQLDPATGKRLGLASASWGWGGMAFQNDKLFVSGIQSQYGTSGATVLHLDEGGENLSGKPTLEGVLQLRTKSLYNFPRLAAMGTPLVVGELICFATVAGDVKLVEADGKVRWEGKLGGTCHATPVAADGHLLIGGDDGLMVAFRQQSGN